MLNNIVVKNFLAIKNCDIKISQFTIVIGPQASGKSLLAKLGYFANWASSKLFASCYLGKTVHEIRATLLSEFFSLFPKYTIKGSDYYIELPTDYGTITIDGSMRYKLYFSEAIKKSIVELKKILNNGQIFDEFIKNRSDREKNDEDTNRFILHYFKSSLSDSPITHTFYPHNDKAIYIPATRSLISILEKNVFSIYNKINTDPVLEDFGRQYELLKSLYLTISTKSHSSKQVIRMATSILQGNYSREGEKEFLVNDGKKNELIHTSSGQQSVLPLIISLLRPFLLKSSTPFNYYIEEPEAHIFPDAQYEMIKLISEINGSHKSAGQYFITTHSPYILSSINNLIIAGSLSNSPETQNEAKQILGISSFIDPSRVSAYKIVNGDFIDIFDYDVNLINADSIDQVSDKIYADFEKLSSY